MTVQEACLERKNSKLRVAYEGQCAKYITTHYLSIIEKSKLINDTLYSDILQFDNDIVTYDSIDKAVFYMLAIIKGYTDLEVGDPYDDFDILMETGFMSNLLLDIGEDTEVFQNLFELRLADIIREHNGIEAVVNKKLEDLISPVEAVLDAVIDGVKSVD